MKRVATAGLGIALAALFGLAMAGQTDLTAEDVIARVRANTTGVEDFDAHITVQIYRDGVVKLTQEARLALLQPDKMRQEFLAPDYFAGNLAIIAGDAVWTYIAANDSWSATDLSLLSDAEQPSLAYRQILRDVQDQLADYAFSMVGVDAGAYHLRGAGVSDAAIYGAIELWVDPATFVPQRRVLYDTDGNLLVDARILDVEEIAPGIYAARRIETYDAEGALLNTVVYDSVAVNQGLDASLFAVPEEATP